MARRGGYFWEHGYRRAAEFAQWKKARGEIEEPMVIGAYIHLGRCFDLTDTWARAELPAYYELVRDLLEANREALPENRPASESDFDLVLRDLDRAVLNVALRTFDDEGGEGSRFYQTVRGVFVEGEPVYAGACIHAKIHVQIAVRDLACSLAAESATPAAPVVAKAGAISLGA